MRPDSCAPGTAPSVLARSKSPNWPSLNPREVFISGIRGIHAMPVMPSKKKPAQTALRARIPLS